MNSNIGHFNILKFHALIHFKENICLYEYVDKYCTNANSETRYCYIIKAFYNLINKWNLLF